MRRNENLQPLSRQHHNGLLMVLLLSKGHRKQADIQVMADFILDAWQKELQQHIIMEEQLLIPALQGKSFNHDLTNRLLSEHSQIRSIIDRIQQNNFTMADLSQFTHTLEQHIRFEERIYFPEVETILTQDELQHIGSLLMGCETSNCINYAIKFWE